MALNNLKNSLGKTRVNKTSQSQLESVRRYKLKNKLKIKEYNSEYYENINKTIKRDKYISVKLFNELPMIVDAY
jgi:hypothetical protein